MARNSLPATMKAANDKFAPAPITKLPDCPSDEIGYKYAWTVIGNQLIKHKVLSEPDLPYFDHYCYLYSLLLTYRGYMDEKLAKNSFFDITDRGNSRVDPNVKQYESMLKTFTQLSEHFGLTPKSRGKIGIGGPATAKKDSLAKLMEDDGDED